MKLLLLIFFTFILSTIGQGVYFYRRKADNKVVYVGMSNNFERRHNEHWKNGKDYSNSKEFRMDKFYMPKSTRKDRRKVEKYYIKKYKPKYNKRK